MKTLILIASILILSSCAARVPDHRNKTFRPAKVQKVKLKKSKLPKKYRINELSKREKKQKAYKLGKSRCGNLATYTNKSQMHYWKASKKINPKFLCVPN